MKPRLGIHCPGTGSGGPWRYVHSLLKYTDLNMYDIRIFCDINGVYEPRPEIETVAMNPTSPERKRRDDAAPSLTRRARTSNLRVITGFLRSARQLSHIFKPHKLDLLHTQNTGCEEAPVAARLAGIPHIVGTFHTDSTYDLHGERNSWGYRFLERLSNRCLHRAIAVSAATGRDWQRRTFLPASRIVTIHNGIDAEQFARRNSRAAARLILDPPQEAFLVVGLGRLDDAKGFADLIEAASLLRAAQPNLVIAIAGDGPLRAWLEALAQAKHVNVRFLGFINNVQTVLDAADLFALPSLCEACPYAVLEAMAAGVPVLGSDVGGVSELLRGAGLVLPPRNPEAWAVAIRKLAGDAPRREQMAVSGRQRVLDEFRERDMVDKTFNVYRQLLME